MGPDCPVLGTMPPTLSVPPTLSQSHTHFLQNTHCKVTGVKTAIKCMSESPKLLFYIWNMTLPKLQ